jgi:hypothetical protein
VELRGVDLSADAESLHWRGSSRPALVTLTRIPPMGSA